MIHIYSFFSVSFYPIYSTLIKPYKELLQRAVELDMHNSAHGSVLLTFLFNNLLMDTSWAKLQWMPFSRDTFATVTHLWHINTQKHIIERILM